MSTTKIRNILLVLIAFVSLSFYSCESNDALIIQSNTPVPVLPNNKVFIEMFTNTSCIPCVQPNQYLDNIHGLSGVTGNDTNVIIMRVHTTLFAGDPFYLYNTTDNGARMNYYNAAAVNPRVFLEGSVNLGGYNAVNWTSSINGKLNETKSYAITLTNNYNTGARTGTISVKVDQISGSNVGDLVLHLALVENEISYNAPNGETIFDNTLRDLVTPVGGDGVNLNAGGNVTLNYNYTVDGIINDEHVDLIAFIQQVSNKNVYAAEEVKIR